MGSCGCEFVVSLEEVKSCRKVPVLPAVLLAEGREAILRTVQASAVLLHCEVSPSCVPSPGSMCPSPSEKHSRCSSEPAKGREQKGAVGGGGQKTGAEREIRCWKAECLQNRRRGSGFCDAGAGCGKAQWEMRAGIRLAAPAPPSTARRGARHSPRSPLSPPQALPGSARGETADIRSVRWAVWSPDLGAGEAEVVLPLRGGACRGPCQTLVYRTPTGGRSSRQVRARFCAAKYTGTLPVLGRACR